MGQFDYNKKRYWYHLSYNFSTPEIEIFPWDNWRRRAGSEPSGNRLCVCPSVAHCLTALPHRPLYHIYRTFSKIIAEEPEGVYDSEVTKEAWIVKKIKLKKIGFIDLDKISEELGWRPIEAAVVPRIDWSRRALKEWNQISNLYMDVC